MPHQCLSCGHLFAEGSSAILQGCPECKGTRFFYTATPVGQEERKAIATKAQKDIRAVVADMLQDTAPETAAEINGGAQWASLKASDLRRIVRKVQEEQARLEAASPRPRPGDATTAAGWENPDARPVPGAAPDLATIHARLAQAEAAAQRKAKPDTVNVRGSGEYDIDVKGLMDDAPIVVHKDGAYLIHLPSLFGQPGAKK